MPQENKQNQREGIELFSYDPIVIVWDVFKRWYLILAVAVLVGMATFVHAEISYKPVYTTNATLVVSSRGNSTTVYQNLQAASNLAAVFSDVLDSSLLRKAIQEDLDMDSFDGIIETAPVANTNLITLRVTDSDPRTAFLVTRALIEKHSLVSYKVMGDVILEVLQEPLVPVAPSNPLAAGHQTKMMMLLASAVTLVLLALMSFLRDTVRSKEEAETKLEVRVLGELHHERKVKNLALAIKQGKKKTSVLITNPTTSFSYVEKIRKLRRHVEQHMPSGGKVLMITSVLENEGKSTVAVNLALSMAQKQKRILLIDGDLRRPACYKVLERTLTKAGTKDVILGCETLANAVMPYGKDGNLSLLLEVREHRTSTDYVGSEGMKKLLDQARAQFDFIIIDTPPMAVAPDAECIAELVDASLLVVRQNAATAGMLNHALDILSDAQSMPLGCVLNNMYAPVLSEIGSYGYGYGYGYGGHYGKYGKYGHYGKYGASHNAHRKNDEGTEHEE